MKRGTRQNIKEKFWKVQRYKDRRVDNRKGVNNKNTNKRQNNVSIKQDHQRWGYSTVERLEKNEQR